MGLKCVTSGHDLERTCVCSRCGKIVAGAFEVDKSRWRSYPQSTLQKNITSKENSHDMFGKVADV